MKTTTMKINRYKQGELKNMEDCLVKEFPLTIYLNDIEYATLLCTPTDIEELVLGFLFSEYRIERKEDISQLIIDDDKGLVYVTLQSKDDLPFKMRYITSGCAQSTAFYKTEDAIRLHPVQTMSAVEATELLENMKRLNQSSETFKETGGVHVAGMMIDNQMTFMEDIGRHNAVDKLIGHMILRGIEGQNQVIYLSGRISSEMVLKCARYQIGMIVSRSAAMDRAVKIGEKLKVTIVGFARGQQMNIYCGQDRIEV